MSLIALILFISAATLICSHFNDSEQETYVYLSEVDVFEEADAVDMLFAAFYSMSDEFLDENDPENNKNCLNLRTDATAHYKPYFEDDEVFDSMFHSLFFLRCVDRKTR